MEDGSRELDYICVLLGQLFSSGNGGLVAVMREQACLDESGTHRPHA